MSKPLESPSVERAPDGLTKLEVRRLRTKYKRLKPGIIENIIDLLADQDSKSSDVANKFKIIEHIEAMLGIVPSKHDLDDSEPDTNLSAAIDALKESSGAESES